MEEKEILEARKFLALIADPKIRPFIDVKKVCASRQYRAAVDSAAAHALKHGDFSYLNKVLAMVDETPQSVELITYLRSKLNFVIAPTTPKTFKKSAPEIVEKIAVKAVATPSTSKKLATSIVGKKVAKKRNYDLLDSYLRVSGSFGSGKRR